MSSNVSIATGAVSTAGRRFVASYRIPNRINELTNASERDRAATLIELREERDRHLAPDEAPKYLVTLSATGEVLIERARDPEHEAARVLADRNVDGDLITCFADSSIIAQRMRTDWAASRFTSESNSRGMQVRKFERMSRSVVGLRQGGRA